MREDDCGDREQLLEQLQKHGEQFMGMFGRKITTHASKKRKLQSSRETTNEKRARSSSESRSEIAYDGWEGITANVETDSVSIPVVDYSKAIVSCKSQERYADRKTFMVCSIRSQLPLLIEEFSLHQYLNSLK
jgi:hypothetical protein